MLGLSHTFPEEISFAGSIYRTRFGPGVTVNESPSDVQALYWKSVQVDEPSLEILKNLSMNYPEGAKAVPKGGGRIPGASEFTPGQRTQIWKTAVEDERSRP